LTPFKILNDFFGYSKFNPGQREIIDTIIAGHNVLAILPTGGGKSICYQIPAILAESVSIVISPLIALMKDQVDSLNQKGNISAFINSSLDYRETAKVLNNVDSGKIKLLYVSPEKLSNSEFVNKVKTFKPSYLFIDEAHCISEWGHNFRPSYRKIKEFIENVEFLSISAFTATATNEVRTDIIEQLGMNNPKIFVRGFERDNLKLNVIQTINKKEKLINILNMSEFPAIIYTATRKNSEEVCELIRSKGIDSVYYHAGLSSELRRIIHDDFQSGRVKLICATNAFGMGIDKSNIRTLIHYNMPSSIENYYQEIGRAGRDGKESNIFLLYNENDKTIQKYFIDSSYPTREQLNFVYDTICDSARIAIKSKYEKEIPLDDQLKKYFETKGINNTLVETTVKILCSSGYFTASMNTKHQVQLLINIDKAFSLTKNLSNNELSDLLLILLREYGSKIFSKNIVININKLASALGETNEFVIDSLIQFRQAGFISYELPSKFPSVRLVDSRIKTSELKFDMEQVEQRKIHETNKLKEMINYVFYEDCKFKFLLNYFGQVSNKYKCGKCDNCKNSSEDFLTSASYLEEHIIDLLKNLKKRCNKNTITNILLGKDFNTRFASLATFGSCIHYTKQQIETTYSLLARKGIIKYHNKEIELLGINDNLNEKEIISNKTYETELQLFNLLRNIRQDASKKYNQPPQMICSDEILRNISKVKPTTISELLEIDGFNQRMYNKIGEEFLIAIKENEDNTNTAKFLKKKNLSENFNFILELVQKKYSLSDIASISKLPESIVSIQIETLIEAIPTLEIDHMFEKGEFIIIKNLAETGILNINELREKLGNKISYTKLRIALAKIKSQ
jgi:ATP-dependent DNA helicase RecQ